MARIKKKARSSNVPYFNIGSLTTIVPSAQISVNQCPLVVETLLCGLGFFARDFFPRFPRHFGSPLGFVLDLGGGMI